MRFTKAPEPNPKTLDSKPRTPGKAQALSQTRWGRGRGSAPPAASPGGLGPSVPAGFRPPSNGPGAAHPKPHPKQRARRRAGRQPKPCRALTGARPERRISPGGSARGANRRPPRRPLLRRSRSGQAGAERATCCARRARRWPAAAGTHAGPDPCCSSPPSYRRGRGVGRRVGLCPRRRRRIVPAAIGVFIKDN